jgi:PPM family protein phosphatase
VDRLLDGALRFSNDEVYRVLHGDGGAAVVLAAWTPTGRYVAHAGDARAYHIGNDGQIQQITDDDTVKGQLAKLGRPAADESELHSKRLQFVGVGPELTPHVARVPDGGRGLVLTPDGVHSMPPAVMEWVIQGASHLQHLADRLVTASTL